jgi:hypothetical protein
MRLATLLGNTCSPILAPVPLRPRPPPPPPAGPLQNESLRKALADAQRELKERDRHSAEATSSATEAAGKLRQAEQLAQRLRMELDWTRRSAEDKERAADELRRGRAEDAARHATAREVRDGEDGSGGEECTAGRGGRRGC